MANNNSMSFNIDGSPSEKRRIIDDGSSYVKRRIIQDEPLQIIDDETLQHLRPLVSIDYVRVNNIIHLDREEMDQVYRKDEINDEEDMKNGRSFSRIVTNGIFRNPSFFGTVMVRDCLGDDIVYHQSCDGNKHLPMPLPHRISLIGPRRAISGNATFIICVNFWLIWLPLCDIGGIIKEMARGEIVWIPYTQDPSSYDKPLQQDVLGKCGSVTVGYSVIREALSATFDVVWMNESVACIYGTVKAVRVLGGSSTTRMLFDKPRTLSNGVVIPVPPRRSIIYSRELDPQRLPFPVPIDSLLTIEVDLWDTSYPDHPSVQGTVHFTPKFGQQKTNITGKYGKVQVSITCN